MAKKKSSSSSKSNSDRSDWLAFSRVLAFIALVLAIVVLIVTAILMWTNSSWGSVGILYLIKDLALIGAILIPAWYFVKPKTKVWRIIYIICVVIVIVFAVLGNINII